MACQFDGLKTPARPFGEITSNTCLSDPDRPTGTASIIVDDAQGENAIIIVPGACDAVTEADVDAASQIIANSALFITQVDKQPEKFTEIVITSTLNCSLNKMIAGNKLWVGCHHRLGTLLSSPACHRQSQMPTTIPIEVQPGIRTKERCCYSATLNIIGQFIKEGVVINSITG